jgi:DNA replication protein DnaC
MSDVYDDLGRIGLRASKSQLEALLTHATKNRLSPVQVIEHLVEVERRERDARNLAARTQRASVGAHKTMDLFDWDHPSKIERALCEQQVLSLAFVQTRTNVLFRGPAGLGKTMLEQNTATAALAAGMTVCFTNVGTALADLLRQESIPAVERRIKRYTHVDVLVFDELGYVPCDARAATFSSRSSAAVTRRPPPSSPPTSPSRSGAPCFTGLRALSHSSTASHSIWSPSTSRASRTARRKRASLRRCRGRRPES